MTDDIMAHGISDDEARQMAAQYGIRILVGNDKVKAIGHAAHVSERLQLDRRSATRRTILRAVAQAQERSA